MGIWVPHFALARMTCPTFSTKLLISLARELAIEGAGTAGDPVPGEGKIVAGEGIISAGKTRLIGDLVAFVNSKGQTEWTALFEAADPELLALFYAHLDDKPRNPYAFCSQVSFLQSRILTNLQAQALCGKRNSYGNQCLPSKVVVTDRSMIGDGVFAIANRLLSGILPEEYNAYRSIRRSHKPLTQDVTLFLDVNPQRAFDLMQKRASPYEKTTPMWYLVLLRTVYFHVLRELASTGNARIAVLRNDPFVTPSQALHAIEHAPSTELTASIWARAKVSDNSDEAVDAAFEALHALYKDETHCSV